MTPAPEMKKFIHAIEQIAAANCAHHVDVITIELGATCSVSPNYFYHIFQNASQNTVMEDAELVFIDSHDVNSQNANNIILCGIEIS